MKLQLWAIGKPNEPYVAPGVEDFSRRLRNYFPTTWKIIPPPRNASSLSEADLKKKEAELILSGLGKEDWLVALDEHGKLMDSQKLSSFIQSRANESVKQLVFLIGGAYGLDQTILKRANFSWSLSPLTFPHQLVRLIMAEQLYRACTILKNEKYHHT
jgi:23S rRNA (pseudouridine1915-N3)-methyltransferase